MRLCIGLLEGQVFVMLVGLGLMIAGFLGLLLELRNERGQVPVLWSVLML